MHSGFINKNCYIYNRPIKGVKKELEVEFHAERYEATSGTLYDYDSF